MTHPRARRRAPFRTLLASGAVAGLVLATVPAQALTAADVEPRGTAASRSATWLVDQLGPDHLVHGEYEYPAGTWVPYVDHGLSLDLVYAFRRLKGHAAEQDAILDAMEGLQDDYTGAGAYAGALGKLVQLVVSDRRDVDTYGDGQLDDQLRARVVTADTTERGRAKDSGDDYSNTIGQAFVVRAFAALGDDARLAETTAFLLRQQCSAGFFREGMDGTDNSCDASAKGQRSSSVDATAHAVRALIAARAAGVRGLRDDIDAAVAYLLRSQRRDGAWNGNGAANADSTGLAAYALASTGHPGAAGTAAAWVRRHQVDGRTIRRHPALQGENGAIAYADEDLAAGRADGVSRASRRTWQRATAEGALALPSLLPRRTLRVGAPDRARRGSRVTVTVRGLRAGEAWTLKRGHKVVAHGRVPAGGRVVTAVRLPDRRAKVTLTALGSRLGRSGTERVRVR